MRKIKSVKLKNDLMDTIKFANKGSELQQNYGKWLLIGNDKNRLYTEDEIIHDCNFEVEYEEERKYTDFRIEYDNLEGSFGTLKIEVENIGSALRSMFRPDFNFKITKLAEGTK